jgi:hypothetical protein
MKAYARRLLWGGIGISRRSCGDVIMEKRWGKARVDRLLFLFEECFGADLSSS